MCNKCKRYKKEIEFEYMYFQREYKHVCRECDGYKRPLDITKPKLNKIIPEDPGELSGNSGELSS